jgi:hypothetical protein
MRSVGLRIALVTAVISGIAVAINGIQTQRQLAVGNGPATAWSAALT